MQNAHVRERNIPIQVSFIHDQWSLVLVWSPCVAGLYRSARSVCLSVCVCTGPSPPVRLTPAAPHPLHSWSLQDSARSVCLSVCVCTGPSPPVRLTPAAPHPLHSWSPQDSAWSVCLSVCVCTGPSPPVRLTPAAAISWPSRVLSSCTLFCLCWMTALPLCTSCWYLHTDEATAERNTIHKLTNRSITMAPAIQQLSNSNIQRFKLVISIKDSSKSSKSSQTTLPDVKYRNLGSSRYGLHFTKISMSCSHNFGLFTSLAPTPLFNLTTEL